MSKEVAYVQAYKTIEAQNRDLSVVVFEPEVCDQLLPSEVP
jgi:hypothetical protein